MFRKIYLLLGLGLLLSVEGRTQSTITLSQQQFIQNRAKSKVKTFTEYLELLGRTKSSEVEERAQIKETIYLSFGRDGGKTRINNDIVPPTALQSTASVEKSIHLESYLNKIAEHYREGFNVSYTNLLASDVYYSSSDNWYFVKVMADRKVQGVYISGSERIDMNTQEKVDFFISANLVNNKITMGGIYAVQPHIDKEYTKAKIVIDQNSKGTVVLIGKPLKINNETIRKKYKRGKEYTLTWDGGLADDIIKIELIPKDTSKHKRKQFNAMLNGNSFTFAPNSNNKLGSYRFKLQNISTGRYTQSGYFEVRRRIPLVASIGVGVLAVVAAIHFDLFSTKSPSAPSPIDDPRSPFPP